jgi:hypothetical protein
MVIRYVISSNGEVVATLNSMDEATQAVEMFKLQSPHNTFEIDTINVSLVKSGFGRDPDLH